jgi:hypothetical protein
MSLGMKQGLQGTLSMLVFGYWGSNTGMSELLFSILLLTFASQPTITQPQSDDREGD